MASESDDDKKNQDEGEGEAAMEAIASGKAIVHERDSEEGATSSEEEQREQEEAATVLGVQRYVHAAFFGAGILSAYLLGKVFQSAWNSLVDWPELVRAMPVLIEYAEDERASITLIMGAVVGAALVLRYYRRPAVRSWATDVATELARVTWPNKDTVTNGTIVVLIAGAVATFYVAVLDRLWGYLTNLVYGV